MHAHQVVIRHFATIYINIIFFYLSAVAISEMPVDPNEPVYCFCRQVSYGEMVACDNDEVITVANVNRKCKSVEITFF